MSKRKLGLSVFSAVLFLSMTGDALAQNLWAPDGVVVSTSNGIQDDGSGGSDQLASDGAGGLYVAWRDTGTVVEGKPFAAPPLGQANLLLTHFDSHGAVTSGWPILITTGISTNTQNQNYADDIVSDNAGGVVLSWINPAGTAYFQRINSSGSPKWSGGADASGIGSGPMSLGNASGDPIVAGDAVFIGDFDGNGNAFMNALDLGTGAQHSGFSGLGVQFLNRSLTHGLSFGSSVPSPASAAEPTAGIISMNAAEFSGTAALDIQAMRIDATGTKNWQVAVTNNGFVAGNGHGGTAKPDGSGGFYAVWADNRPAGTGPGIYAAHFDGAGNGKWGAPNGTLIAAGQSGVGFQDHNPSQNSASGPAGFMVTWSTTSGGFGVGDSFGQIVIDNRSFATPALSASATDLGAGNNDNSASILTGGQPLYLFTFDPWDFSLPPAHALDVLGNTVYNSTYTTSWTRLDDVLNTGSNFVVTWSNCAGSCNDAIYAQAISAPAPLAGLTGTVHGPDSLSWSWPAVAGATGYSVYWLPNVITPVTTLGAQPSGQTYGQTGLTPNTAYAVGVTPNTNPATPSAVSTLYTLAAPPPDPTVSAVNFSSVTLSWSANGNPAGTEYQAFLWAAGGSTTTLTVTSLSATFTSLTPGTNYFMTVNAVNADGIVAPSNITVSATTKSAAPNDLSNIKAYPNPWRVSLGTTAMTFTLVPANTRLRIYTLNGTLVKDLAADLSGTAKWDGTNQSGGPVSSGFYFVFAQGAGKRKTVKVAIQR